MIAYNIQECIPSLCGIARSQGRQRPQSNGEWAVSSQTGIVQNTLIYKTVDGLTLPADVIYRPGTRRAPAILWLHGGALIRGSRSGLWPAARARYLQAGFVVVPVDYRLGPETRLPEIVSDVQAAYAWLRAGGAGPAVD